MVLIHYYCNYFYIIPYLIKVQFGLRFPYIREHELIMVNHP
jgi:hypothetical protein|uniref:Uncharacterized protein n=1 Tax=Planktothrix agardhii TaxID=1160 RepID=A0A1J1JFA4_PLAAG|nr:protein of unknown function [Planktothrix agardhii]